MQCDMDITLDVLWFAYTNFSNSLVFIAKRTYPNLLNEINTIFLNLNRAILATKNL